MIEGEDDGMDAYPLINTLTHSDIIITGGLAQLARAPALHAGGQRFESVILHASQQKQETRSKKQDKSWLLVLDS